MYLGTTSMCNERYYRHVGRQLLYIVGGYSGNKRWKRERSSASCWLLLAYLYLGTEAWMAPARLMLGPDGEPGSGRKGADSCV